MPTADAFKNIRLWVWLVTIGGALIRVLTLAKESFWNDEAFSGFAAQQNSLADVLAIARHDVHPPGHLILGWFWGQAFGVNDFSLRLTSALAGICLIPVTFHLGKRLYDEKTGFIGALMMAFLTQPIYFSQEFRAYILVALLAAITAVLIFDVLETATGKANLPIWKPIALALVLIANAYLHYFGLFFSLLAAAYLLWRTAKVRSLTSIPIACLVALVLSYVPWLPEMAKASKMHSHPEKPGVWDVLLFPNALLGPGWILVLLACVVVGAGLLKWRDSPREWRPSDIRLVGWVLVPLVFEIVASYIFVPIYTPRNLFFAITPTCLLLARAFGAIGTSWKSALGIAAGFLVLHAGIQLGTKGHFIKPTKQQLREASQYVLDHRVGGEAVEIAGWDNSNIGYYFNQAGKSSVLVIVPIAKGRDYALPQQPGTFWRLSAGVPLPPRSEIEKHYRILDQADFTETHVLKLQIHHTVD